MDAEVLVAQPEREGDGDGQQVVIAPKAQCRRIGAAAPLRHHARQTAHQPAWPERGACEKPPTTSASSTADRTRLKAEAGRSLTQPDAALRPQESCREAGSAADREVASPETAASAVWTRGWARLRTRAGS